MHNGAGQAWFILQVFAASFYPGWSEMQQLGLSVCMSLRYEFCYVLLQRFLAKNISLAIRVEASGPGTGQATSTAAEHSASSRAESFQQPFLLRFMEAGAISDSWAWSIA